MKISSFFGNLPLVARIPLSLRMDDALRARFGALGAHGLVSNLRGEVGGRAPPENDVGRRHVDLAQALLLVSGGGDQFAARLRNSLIANSAGLAMRFDLMGQWPWRFLAGRGDA